MDQHNWMTVPEVYCSNKSALIQTSVFQAKEGRMSSERNMIERLPISAQIFQVSF
jgi:ureidoglycolate hydrolase